MKIEFRNADGGDIIVVKQSEELKDVLSTITREGTQINIYFSKTNYFNGKVDGCMLDIDEELKDNILKIFVAEPSFYQIKQNRIFKGSYIK